jgi:hypothetical protein
MYGIYVCVCVCVCLFTAGYDNSPWRKLIIVETMFEPKKTTYFVCILLPVEYLQVTEQHMKYLDSFSTNRLKVWFIYYVNRAQS